MKLDTNNIKPEGLLELKEVGISINGYKLFEKLNIKIPQGSIVSVMGPSGCGKSTLLRCLNGLEEVTSGDIIINDKSILEKKCLKKNLKH